MTLKMLLIEAVLHNVVHLELEDDDYDVIANLSFQIVMTRKSPG